MNNPFLGLFYSGLFILILLFVELITRKKNLNKELSRKTIHILAGLFGAGMGIYFNSTIFILLIFAFNILIIVSYYKSFFTSIHKVKRRTYGEILFPLGILSAYLISNGNIPIYVASVLILTISDPLAGLLGNIVKKKSYIGSFAFFITTLIIIFTIFGLSGLFQIIIISLIITQVEKISSYGTDNLTIPATASLLLKFFL